MMAATTGTKFRITAEVVDEFVAARNERKRIESSAKPFADRETKLAKQILEALQEAGINKKRVGEHQLSVVEKDGLVKWKDLAESVLSADDIAAAQKRYASEKRFSLEVV